MHKTTQLSQGVVVVMIIWDIMENSLKSSKSINMNMKYYVNQAAIPAAQLLQLQL